MDALAIVLLFQVFLYFMLNFCSKVWFWLTKIREKCFYFVPSYHDYFPKGEHVFNLWWYNLCSNERGVLQDQISEALSSWNSRSHSWTSHTNVSMYFSPFQNLRFPITSWKASRCYSFLISSTYIYFTVSPKVLWLNLMKGRMNADMNLKFRNQPLCLWQLYTHFYQSLLALLFFWGLFTHIFSNCDMLT